MTALLTRPRGTDDTAADLFCGFGGSSQGMHAAGLNVRLAANHNELAVQCHAKNFPDTEHFRADLSNQDAADYVDPADLPPVAYLWASPSCKNHSQANAKKVYAQGPQSLFDDGEPFDHVAYANSERSRVTMMCPLRYAAKHRPSFVVVENVVEVTNWAHLDHIVAASLGGGHGLENLRWLDPLVNVALGNMTDDEFRALCSDVLTNR